MCSSKASGRNYANGDARSFPRPLFIPLLGAGIAGIASVQVMTPYFGLKVDLKGVVFRYVRSPQQMRRVVRTAATWEHSLLSQTDENDVMWIDS